MTPESKENIQELRDTILQSLENFSIEDSEKIQERITILKERLSQVIQDSQGKHKDRLERRKELIQTIEDANKKEKKIHEKEHIKEELVQQAIQLASELINGVNNEKNVEKIIKGEDIDLKDIIGKTLITKSTLEKNIPSFIPKEMPVFPQRDENSYYFNLTHRILNRRLNEKITPKVLEDQLQERMQERKEKNNLSEYISLTQLFEKLKLEPIEYSHELITPKHTEKREKQNTQQNKKEKNIKTIKKIGILFSLLRKNNIDISETNLDICKFRNELVYIYIRNINKSIVISDRCVPKDSYGSFCSATFIVDGTLSLKHINNGMKRSDLGEYYGQRVVFDNIENRKIKVKQAILREKMNGKIKDTNGSIVTKNEETDANNNRELEYLSPKDIISLIEENFEFDTLSGSSREEFIIKYNEQNNTEIKEKLHVIQESLINTLGGYSEINSLHQLKALIRPEDENSKKIMEKLENPKEREYLQNKYNYKGNEEIKENLLKALARTDVENNLGQTNYEKFIKNLLKQKEKTEAEVGEKRKIIKEAYGLPLAAKTFSQYLGGVGNTSTIYQTLLIESFKMEQAGEKDTQKYKEIGEKIEEIEQERYMGRKYTKRKGDDEYVKSIQERKSEINKKTDKSRVGLKVVGSIDLTKIKERKKEEKIEDITQKEVPIPKKIRLQYSTQEKERITQVIREFIKKNILITYDYIHEHIAEGETVTALKLREQDNKSFFLLGGKKGSRTIAKTHLASGKEYKTGEVTETKIYKKFPENNHILLETRGKNNNRQ